MIESLTKTDVLVGLAINGIFTGLGTAIGSYLANKQVIERLAKIKKKISKGMEIEI